MPSKGSFSLAIIIIIIITVVVVVVVFVASTSFLFILSNVNRGTFIVFFRHTHTQRNSVKRFWGQLILGVRIFGSVSCHHHHHIIVQHSHSSAKDMRIHCARSEWQKLSAPSFYLSFTDVNVIFIVFDTWNNVEMWPEFFEEGCKI